VEDQQQEKGEFELMMAGLFDIVGAFVISDFVAWLSFFTRLQGYHSRFEDVHNRKQTIGAKMVALEKHKESAKKRELLQQQENHEEEADYVPDFVDLLMNAPLDHGKLYADRDLVSLITVRMPMHFGTHASLTPSLSAWRFFELLPPTTFYPHYLLPSCSPCSLIVGSQGT
jgi:hypothetical protein